jgi:hypothetical protein
MDLNFGPLDDLLDNLEPFPPNTPDWVRRSFSGAFMIGSGDPQSLPKYNGDGNFAFVPHVSVLNTIFFRQYQGWTYTNPSNSGGAHNVFLRVTRNAIPPYAEIFDNDYSGYYPTRLFAVTQVINNLPGGGSFEVYGKSDDGLWCILTMSGPIGTAVA